MRPIFWGFTVFLFGIIFWLIVSIYTGLQEGFTGSTNLYPLVWIFGLTWMFSLPAALAIEVARWWRRRRKGQSRSYRV